MCQRVRHKRPSRDGCPCHASRPRGCYPHHTHLHYYRAQSPSKRDEVAETVGGWKFIPLPGIFTAQKVGTSTHWQAIKTKIGHNRLTKWFTLQRAKLAYFWKSVDKQRLELLYADYSSSHPTPDSARPDSVGAAEESVPQKPGA